MSLDAVLNRRLLIISGKGGVGKTTVTGALGILAARHDLRVLLVEFDGRDSLSNLFEIGRLGPEPVQLRYNLQAINVSPEEALKEYFEVQLHMKRIARPLITSQLVDAVTSSAPGLRDILMLGKIWYMATHQQDLDLIVLDAPATGHAVSMLRSPEGFLRAVPVGPLATHTRQILTWLQNPEYVAVNIVGLAEDLPVNETIETVGALEEQLGFNVEHVFLNMIYPPVGQDETLDKAAVGLEGPESLVAFAQKAGSKLSAKNAAALHRCAEFYSARRKVQKHHSSRLEEAVGHTARTVDLPFYFDSEFGEKHLENIADLIEEQLT
ncbi:MAG TPA: ArsA family ATPase [Actinomycetota bacterium]|nr:ArsA family ATPase [Actinomycetota bacterium]